MVIVAGQATVARRFLDVAGRTGRLVHRLKAALKPLAIGVEGMVGVDETAADVAVCVQDMAGPAAFSPSRLK